MKRTTNKKRNHKVIPLLPYCGTLYTTTSVEEFVRLQKKVFGGDVASNPAEEDSITYGVTLSGSDAKTGRSVYIVYYDCDATLVHELAHVTMRVFNAIGTNPTDAEEPFCYFLDHLFALVNPESSKPQ